MIKMNGILGQKVLHLLAGLGIIILISAPFWLQLNALTEGLSDAEQAQQTLIDDNQLTLSNVFRDPFFLPYKLLLLIIQVISLPSFDHVRLASAALATLGVIGWFYIIKSWHSQRLAILSTVLFGTSAWTLLIGRYASPESSYLLLPFLLAAWLWTLTAKRTFWPLFITLLIGIGALYIPGMVWFIIPAIVLQRRNLLLTISKLNSAQFSIVGFVAMLGILPLIISLVFPYADKSALHNGLTFLGLPDTFPNISQFWANISSAFMHIFIKSTGTTLLAVGTLPLLSIFISAMVIIGVWSFALNRIRLDRTRITLLFIIGGFILLGFDGPVFVSILLPVLFICATEGIGHLLGQWLSVFPKNPFARPLGITLMTMAIITTCLFQITSYFVAWPHTSAAIEAFHLQDKN